MTAVVLREGGLLVNNPVAPTTECLDLLRSLVDRHGPVRHITLSSAALEHKVSRVLGHCDASPIRCGQKLAVIPRARVLRRTCRLHTSFES
jgi:hypothetical protein